MGEVTTDNKAPSLAFYAQLQLAFEHFNERLFGSALPDCLLTLRSRGRQHGYHHAVRFVNAQGHTLDELALNPGHFTLRPPEQVLSTLVHEMVHHWQVHFGQPTRSNAHNRQWGQKMREVGLEPSSTGLPGGKTVGSSVSHFILPGGPFIAACRDLLSSGYQIPWYDRHVPRSSSPAEVHQALERAGVAVPLSAAPVQLLTSLDSGEAAVFDPPAARPVTRIRYVCGLCGTSAWAGPRVSLVCEPCGAPLLSASLMAEFAALHNEN